MGSSEVPGALWVFQLFVCADPSDQNRALSVSRKTLFFADIAHSFTNLFPGL